MNTETEDSAIYTDIAWNTEKFTLSRDYTVRPIWVKSCKRKGTFLIETLFKQDEDRKWLYIEFIPMLYELAENAGIPKDSIIVTGRYACVYVPAQLLYYVIEYYDFMEVNYIWDRFSSTDTAYADEDVEYIVRELRRDEDTTK